jgi:hypothetical protein
VGSLGLESFLFFFGIGLVMAAFPVVGIVAVVGDGRRSGRGLSPRRKLGVALLAISTLPGLLVMGMAITLR